MRPPPVADAVAALLAATDPREQRDRVVEVFRAISRLVGVVALGVRVQFGHGPGAPDSRVDALLVTLGRRGLTDGQWIELTRRLLRPWGDACPVPGLTPVFFDKRVGRASDELLAMRKSETVAHGPTGDAAWLDEVLERRVPQLLTLLDAYAAWFRAVSWVVPDGDSVLWLRGPTPTHERWPRLPLRVDGAVVLLAGDRPCVDLGSVARFTSPVPGAPRELFVLDGGRRGAAFVALPSMAELVEPEGLDALGQALEADADELEGRPYRGLAGFGPEHADRFFGRDREIAVLANRVRAHPIVTVTGASGSGKSSLVAAGVIPALRAARAVVLRPGFDPGSALARAMAELVGDPSLAGADVEPPALAHALRDWCDREEIPLAVLVVDQAEELLTLSPPRDSLERFVATVGACGADPRGPTRVVLTVREDFFVRLASIPGFRQRVDREVEVVVPPERDALIATLVRPAEAFGVAFEDFGLVGEMVDAVDGQPSALPLLQFCADRLWDLRDRTFKRLTRAGYDALGGVTGALAGHAEATFEALPAESKASARDVLMRLVTPERTRALVARSALSTAVTDDVVEALVQARLLTVRQSDDGPLLEVVHEALIARWDRLQRWLDEDREGQRLRHALAAAAREWGSRGRADGLLWRGDALVEARLAQTRTGMALPALEQDFLTASLARERRVRTLLWGATAAVVAGSLLTAALVGWQWRAAVAAEAVAITAQRRTQAALALAERKRIEAMAAVARAEGDAGASLAYARLLAASADDPQERSRRVAEVAGLELRGGAILTLDAFRAPFWSPDGAHLVGRTGDGLGRLDPRTGVVQPWWEGRSGGNRGFRPPKPEPAEEGTWTWDADLGLVLLPWDGEPRVFGKDAVGEPPNGFVALYREGPWLLVATRERQVLFDVQTMEVGRTPPDAAGHRLMRAVRPLSSRGDLAFMDGVSLRDEGRFVPMTPSMFATWDPSGARVVREIDGALEMWERGGRRLWARSDFVGQNMVREPRFSADGHQLLVGGAEGLSLLDASTGRTLWRTPEARSPASFTPDGAAVVGMGDEPVLLDASTGAVLARWSGQIGGLSLSVHPSDGRWVSGVRGRSMLASLPSVGRRAGDRAPTPDVTCDRLGGLVITGVDGTVLQQDARPCWTVVAAGQEAVVITDLERGPDDHVLRIWDAARGTPMGDGPPKGAPGSWGSWAWSVAAGLAISPMDDQLAAWRPGSEELVWTRPMASAVVPLGDGSRLLVQEEDERTHLVDARTGATLQTLGGTHVWFEAGLGPDGRFVAASHLQLAVVWDLEAPASEPRVVDLQGESLSMYVGDPIALSPRGELLAVGEVRDDSAVVRVYDVATGVWLAEVEGPGRLAELQGRGMPRFDGRTVQVPATDGSLLFLEVPSLVEHAVMERTGAASNLRVCRDSLEVVPKLPFPSPGSVWTDCD